MDPKHVESLWGFGSFLLLLLLGTANASAAAELRGQLEKRGLLCSRWMLQRADMPLVRSIDRGEVHPELRRYVRNYFRARLMMLLGFVLVVLRLYFWSGSTG